MFFRISQQPNTVSRNVIFLFLFVAVLAIDILPGAKALTVRDILSETQEEIPGPLPGTTLRSILFQDIPALMHLHSLVFPNSCSNKFSKPFYRRTIANRYPSVVIVNATSQEILAFSTGKITKESTPGSITGYVCWGVLSVC